ncbi:MAG TPA: hypothetical protein VE871_17285, partial [Longimicrobium sp.]|nr:hypothetical protein [Longimicrobium sp.]
EILGTTIQQSAWATVYRISAKLRDAPGVLHSTLASIARHGGNIVNLDSTSTDQESIHEVEIVVDFASLSKSSNADDDLSDEIEGLLLADCALHIVEEKGGRFALRVTPHAGLRRLDTNLRRLRSNRYTSLVQDAQVEEHGRIVLDEPIKHVLRSYTRAGEPATMDVPISYFVSSDTKSRLFRITLIPDPEQITWCAIRHNDRPGALSAITDAIRTSGLTVLSGLNRVQRHQGRSWFEVILSKENWKGAHHSAEQRRDEVQAALQKYSFGEEFGPELYFDRKQADEAMRTPAKDDATAAAWYLERTQGIEEWLSEKEGLLSESMAGASSDEAAVSTSAYMSALALGIKKVRASRGHIRPRVFLSVEFSKVNQERIETARECCVTRGIDFVVVQGTEEQPVIRDEVLSRIGSATHFIGLWAPSEKDPASKRCSPWLSWELGVASAHRMPYGIVVEKGTNTMDFAHIHGERFHFTFTADQPGSFRREFQRCLDVVLRSQTVHPVRALST